MPPLASMPLGSLPEPQTVFRSERSVGNIGREVEAYLDETNISALLSEALSADVEAVFSDQTGLVGADSAMG